MPTIRRDFVARQRGIATVLIILLAGLAITVAALGVAHVVRGTQEKTSAARDAANAQSRAWLGVELFRQYLLTLTESDLEAWVANGSISVPVSGAPGIAINASAAGTAGDFTVTAEVTGSAAGAVSTVRAVYAVTASDATSSPPPSSGPEGIINYNKNLTLGGSITVSIDANTADELVINVNGDLNTNGNSITGVQAINATGSVSIGSGSSFGTLNANCDVNITGSVSAERINATRHICVAAASDVDYMKANGSVLVTNSGTRNELYALAGPGTCAAGAQRVCDSTYTGWPFNGSFNGVGVSNTITADKIETLGAVKFTNGNTINQLIHAAGSVESSGTSNWNDVKTGGNLTMSNGSSMRDAIVVGSATLTGVTANVLQVGGALEMTRGGAASVQAVGNVTLKDSGSGITTLLGGGNLSLDNRFPVGTPGTPPTSKINGTLSKPSWVDSGIYVQEHAGISVAAPSVAPPTIVAVEPVELETETFDANEFKTTANYVFEYLSGNPRVTVRRVNGIADGQYFLVKGKKFNNVNYNDYLCSSASPASASDCVAKIGRGYDPVNNAAIAYSSGQKKWTITGNGGPIAQGIAWFAGDVELAGGPYFNTVIATSNIKTAGSFSFYAPNFAGYDGVVDGTRYAPTGVCANEHYPALYPKQFCVGGSYEPGADGGIGNYALLAGSYDGSTYVGGNIELGSSTNIYGSIKAGNQFNSGGSTTVHGYITALGQGTSTSNSMGGSTTIDLSNLPPTYSPTGSDFDGSDDEGEDGDEGGGTTANVLWTRYL